uniref:NB-ARC domain-containing protein n=1 Tax=Setaria viridis TaxID=4556 RepID=A0A4U6TIU8_SETVI|nr:hypothetical protein SEVIR_8G140200v2 [Setaria viridis]
MSTFPVGYEIDKHRLIRKWKAEGLIAQNMWRTFEEVAEEYFSELLDRGIIRPVTHGYNFSEVETCFYQVNHFMSQFLASLSAQQNFLTSWTLKSAVVAAATAGRMEARMVQRLSLHQPDPELQALLERTDFSHTRSLTVYGAVNQIPLDKFVHLVVLDLEGWENLKDDDMVQICSSQFFLLKYLSIRCTRVSWLPPQIIELGYLETLDISHTQIRELPSQVWELLELQALDLRNTQVKLLPGALRRLLVNDHQMDKIVTEVPKDIVNWRFLEALETVDLSNCSASFIENLADLRFLEVLAVKWSFHQCYDEKCTSALQSAIHRSGCLKSLTIHCELGCSMEFLDSLADASPVH